MKKIKQLMAAFTMAGIIILSTSFANAGIIVVGAKGDAPGKSGNTTQQCSSPSKSGRVNSGIIVAGLTGIIVVGLTGIIVVGAVDSPITTCGIIVVG